jgi:hypothetical protein
MVQDLNNRISRVWSLTVAGMGRSSASWRPVVMAAAIWSSAGP